MVKTQRLVCPGRQTKIWCDLAGFASPTIHNEGPLLAEGPSSRMDFDKIVPSRARLAKASTSMSDRIPNQLKPIMALSDLRS